MAKQKRDGRNANVVALTGVAALLAIAVNFAISVQKKNRKKKVDSASFMPDLPGSTVHVNLSSSEILRLADRIITQSKKIHDAVASVPLDKVTYGNAIQPLAELEAQQLSLVQSCVFPKLVSAHEDVRKASAEAERRIDAYVSDCSDDRRPVPIEGSSPVVVVLVVVSGNHRFVVVAPQLLSLRRRQPSTYSCRISASRALAPLPSSKATIDM
ncbi:thimet oligopeptidase [Sarracenia purpurea var. burkii]